MYYITHYCCSGKGILILLYLTSFCQQTIAVILVSKITLIHSSRTNPIIHIICRLFTTSFSSSLQHTPHTADLHYSPDRLVTARIEQIAVGSHRLTEQYECPAE